MARDTRRPSFGIQCAICGKTAAVQAGRWGWAVKKFRAMGWRFVYDNRTWLCPEAEKASGGDGA